MPRGCGEIRSALDGPTCRGVAGSSFAWGSIWSLSAWTTRLSSRAVCSVGVDEAESLKHEMNKRRLDVQKLFEARFQRGVEEGDLPKRINAADLARYLTAVQNGLAVQASSGVSRKDLLRVVDLVMTFGRVTSGSNIRLSKNHQRCVMCSPKPKSLSTLIFFPSRSILPSSSRETCEAGGGEKNLLLGGLVVGWSKCKR